mmetsp:Transcript_7968/g.19668  ORF Transcript_7968/g.19668 Transcript_7968/m.19668 type:complete len:219 (-) Transcript_7968:386-1042(-)
MTAFFESKLFDGFILLAQHGGREGGDEVVPGAAEAARPAQVEEPPHVANRVSPGVESSHHARPIHQPQLNGGHRLGLVQLEGLVLARLLLRRRIRIRPRSASPRFDSLAAAGGGVATELEALACKGHVLWLGGRHVVLVVLVHEVHVNRVPGPADPSRPSWVLKHVAELVNVEFPGDLAPADAINEVFVRWVLDVSRLSVVHCEDAVAVKSDGVHHGA